MPQAFLFIAEAVIVSSVLACAVMIKWVGESHRWLKFSLSSWILLMTIYGVFLLVYRFYRMYARGFMNEADALFCTAVIVLGIAAGLIYKNHILKLNNDGRRADNFAGIGLAAAAFALVFVAAHFRQAAGL